MNNKDNILVQKCQMSCTFFKLMEKDGNASCTIWLDEAPTICDLYVNEDQRRQGLATEMLQMCEDLVKAEGYPGVFLYADEGSWLVDWYERKGYKRTGETMKIQGRTVTSVWLYKEF
jgi:GNAT superfamily N-acetyltransferase